MLKTLKQWTITLRVLVTAHKCVHKTEHLMQQFSASVLWKFSFTFSKQSMFGFYVLFNSKKDNGTGPMAILNVELDEEINVQI